MQQKKSAVLNITKAIASVSFATLAAIGGASNNVWLAGLAALPAATLAASGSIEAQLSNIVQKDEFIELPPPSWWQSDVRSWQDLCAEINAHLPSILQHMSISLKQEQRVVTLQVVREQFIEAVMAERLTWVNNLNEQRLVAEFVASPFLLGIDATLQPLIQQKQHETLLLDTRATASSTLAIEQYTRKMAALLEKLYEDGQREHLIVRDETIQKQEMSASIVALKAEEISTSEKSSSVSEQPVVILTALRIEYMAVRAHLSRIREVIHPQGTVYEQGTLLVGTQAWKVAIVEIGVGNTRAAQEVERAVSYFQANLVLFVGVAGGIKDVQLGDVVAATKVYGYESGKAEETFKTRPNVGNSSFRLEQRARAEARKSDWLTRVQEPLPSLSPTIHVAPIAAGEKVLASTRSATWKFLKTHYNDAIAVEMEGYGILSAVQAMQNVEALVIRGISDLIDGKREADAGNFQAIASRYASAFAFQVLTKLLDGV